MEFSRQEYGSGLPFPSPGDFSSSLIEPGSPALKVDSLPFEPQGKPYDKPRQCIKSRDITLLTKFQIVKAMIFPVIMYVCESCTIKKAEHQRVDAFEL